MLSHWYGRQAVGNLTFRFRKVRSSDGSLTFAETRAPSTRRKKETNKQSLGKAKKRKRRGKTGKGQHSESEQTSEGETFNFKTDDEETDEDTKDTELEQKRKAGWESDDDESHSGKELRRMLDQGLVKQGPPRKKPKKVRWDDEPSKQDAEPSFQAEPSFHTEPSFQADDTTFQPDAEPTSQDMESLDGFPENRAFIDLGEYYVDFNVFCISNDSLPGHTRTLTRTTAKPTGNTDIEPKTRPKPRPAFKGSSKSPNKRMSSSNRIGLRSDSLLTRSGRLTQRA